ncbi:MAG TPA: cation diffusion facilitator family transporter [Thermoanaerobaculia bacterium]|nr:cation diffusion facilitator family transporter [Thermoanaerobaculia bacterium]
MATRYAWLSIAAALATMAIKGVAALVTGSVGLLADALESLVNLAAGVLALLVLRVAVRPPDEEHHYGHEKAEYFSSGAEGTLILLAAASILVSGVRRLLAPQPVAQIGLGLVLLLTAALVNLAVGLVLRRAGRRLRSITLRANGQHLLTDVWTSAGVLVALGAVALTGWQALDPLIGLAVALQIAWTGLRLLRSSISGLMDRALPPDEVARVAQVLARHADEEHGEVRFHALRTRRAGARSFVSFHVQVPGAWSVQRGHDLLETMEEEIRRLLPAVSVFTHLEPVEDPVSYHDTGLDRPG